MNLLCVATLLRVATVHKRYKQIQFEFKIQIFFNKNTNLNKIGYGWMEPMDGSAGWIRWTGSSAGWIDTLDDWNYITYIH